MKYSFLPPAVSELQEAIDYYNHQQEGLGTEFRDEVYRTVGRILEYPNAWARLSRRTRRCRTHCFPYGLVYGMVGDMVLILAVAHLSREPMYWKNRLSDLP